MGVKKKEVDILSRLSESRKPYYGKKNGKGKIPYSEMGSDKFPLLFLSVYILIGK